MSLIFRTSKETDQSLQVLSICSHAAKGCRQARVSIHQQLSSLPSLPGGSCQRLTTWPGAGSAVRGGSATGRWVKQRYIPTDTTDRPACSLARLTSKANRFGLHYSTSHSMWNIVSLFRISRSVSRQFSSCKKSCTLNLIKYWGDKKLSHGTPGGT